jgi:hypothetical protein
MKATFEHSVSVLTKAYLNNTLAKGSCSACAVGNLIADGLGLVLVSHRNCLFWGATNRNPEQAWSDYKQTPNWHRTLMVISGQLPAHEQPMSTEPVPIDSEEQLRATGYSDQELILIERAFEQASKQASIPLTEPVVNPADAAGVFGESITTTENKERAMYLGLLAVVDVLAQIHGVDLTIGQVAAEGFEQIYQTRILTQLT